LGGLAQKMSRDIGPGSQGDTGELQMKKTQKLGYKCGGFRADCIRCVRAVVVGKLPNLPWGLFTIKLPLSRQGRWQLTQISFSRGKEARMTV
jgi:hypothetical protein